MHERFLSALTFICLTCKDGELCKGVARGISHGDTHMQIIHFNWVIGTQD